MSIKTIDTFAHSNLYRRTTDNHFAVNKYYNKYLQKKIKS